MEGKSSVIEIRIIPEVLPSSDDQAMSHQLSVRCPQDREMAGGGKKWLTTGFYRLKPAGKKMWVAKSGKK